ncbi:proline dehydrogenase family protein [Candidatus Woesearchaeota archaeon]|nr:proline dehydrogenase family protein [Candidatus Woesearchaeota archaeon]
MGLISLLGEEYLGGHSLEEGVENAGIIFHRGIIRYGWPICSTLDILGEEVKDQESVEKNVESYSTLIQSLGQLTREVSSSVKHYELMAPFTVSVKPSALCLTSRKNCEVEEIGNLSLDGNVTKLISAGRRESIRVTMDMEDHGWTYSTLKLARRMWVQGLALDIVLQSCLDTTLEDVEAFLTKNLPTGFDKSSTTIRACRGIYREPSEIAVTNSEKAKERLYTLVEKLFDAGYFVGIATHDIQLSRRIREEIIEPRGISKNRYEHQGLKGIYSFEDIIMPEALRQQENVRLYLPLEVQPGDGQAYMRRRIVMNPEIMLNYVKDRAGRMRRGMG